MNERMLDESYALTTRLFDAFWARKADPAMAQRLWALYERADERHWRRIMRYWRER